MDAGSDHDSVAKRVGYGAEVAHSGTWAAISPIPPCSIYRVVYLVLYIFNFLSWQGSEKKRCIRGELASYLNLANNRRKRRTNRSRWTPFYLRNASGRPQFF